MRTYQKQYGGPSPPSCLSLGWGDLVSRIEWNMPFCACVCPYAYAYALVKTRPTLFRLKTHTFDARRPSVHTNTMSVFIENARVDQNENAYISCWCGHSTTHQNENNDRKYRRRVCWYHGHGVKIKSQHSILSFLNVLVLIVENASKR